MRRSTAAAVGTLTGAALIIGVRLSVSAPEAAAAPPAADLAGRGLAGESAPASKKPARKPSADRTEVPAAPGTGLTDGVFKGTAVKNVYGTVRVSIRVSGGRITAVDATFPLTGDSATINPPAVARLKQQTLGVTSAEDVDAVSGATFTSESYTESLQAALDAANA